MATSLRHQQFHKGRHAMLRTKWYVFACLELALATSPGRTQELVASHRLSAELASRVVSEVVASCARQGYAEASVVVDAEGVQQALLLGDHAGRHTLDSAFEKAYTAASFKADTSALVERSVRIPGLANLFSQIPHLILFGGGVVITVDGEVVGAIGAAGAPSPTLDEACAQAGLSRLPKQLK